MAHTLLKHTLDRRAPSKVFPYNTTRPMLVCFMANKDIQVVDMSVIHSDVILNIRYGFYNGFVVFNR